MRGRPADRSRTRFYGVPKAGKWHGQAVGRRVPAGDLWGSDRFIVAARRRNLTQFVRGGLTLAVFAVGGATLSLAALPAAAQETVFPPAPNMTPFTPTPAKPGTLGSETSDDINLVADEVGHDEELGIFVARGNVEILSEGKIVKADVVTYNERTERITAAGNVVILEPDGDTQFATYADVTDDVKEGILYDFRMLLKDNARLAASRAERVDQNRKEILHKGVYTPCAPCATDPSRSPLWQVKAYEAVRDKVNKTITYHNAWLEMFGVPVFYTPWFRHPDFGVKRQSGFLSPSINFSSKSGTQIRTPYYATLGPDKDVTFTPILRFGGELQEGPGAVGMLEYRQRLLNGRFRIAGSGTVEDRLSEELQASQRRELHDELRGHVEGDGLFSINDDWRWGFDFKATSDKAYLKRFRLGSRDILTDTAWAEGFFGRSYANARAYAFQTTKSNQQGDQLPIVAPMLDYRFVGEPGIAGAYWGLDANFMNLRRIDGRESVRIAAEPYWTLPYTSSIGDIYRLTFSLPMTIHTVHDVDPDSDVRDPTGDDFDGTVFRAVPKLTFDWRYPLVRATPSFTQVFEPIFQLVAAPDTGNTGKIPNEDSRAFELDDTNVFLSDRFAGLDRADTGSRVTYGAQWTGYLPANGQIGAFLGQSYQLDHDDNDEFRQSGGIADDLTDVVGRVDLRPGNGINLSYRFRFDVEDTQFNRHEARASYGNEYGYVAGAYAFINSDGVEFEDREQASAAVGAYLGDYWSANVNSSYDLVGNRLLSVGGGLKYLDECFELDFSATFTPAGDTEETEGDFAFFLAVNFKNLGGIDVPF